MMRNNKWLIVLLATILAFSFASPSLARRPRLGLGFGVGLGGTIPMNPDHWGFATETPALFYPELKILFDFSGIRTGLTIGMDTYTGSAWDSYWGYYYDIIWIDYAFLGDLVIMPLRFFLPNMAFQPFFGGCVGSYASISDQSGAQLVGRTAYGPKAGFEFYIGEWFVVTLEGRYVIVRPTSTDSSTLNLSYANALLGLRFRIPLIKREF